MQRREFIAVLGSTVAWPLVAGAQQLDRVRRIGVLMGWDENDPDTKLWLSGFVRGLAELGWIDGHNIRMDVRWEGENADRVQMLAKELVSLQPDVIVSSNTPETAALQRETRAIPIVFVTVSDPVGTGFVAGLPHPGGNLTGFMLQEASIGGKLVELLSEIAPNVKRIALMFNPDTAPYVDTYYVPQFEAAARLLKLAPIIAPVHNDAEIETVITTLGLEPKGGLVGAPDRYIVVRRTPIISLAAQYNIPAIYVPTTLVRGGGLLSYGPDFADIFRRSASYVDRILRGEKPADLPVQLPIKFQMAINLRTAKALGLTVPDTLLVTADEVIE
jgi:putative tryptophan/tyrosine transport system substrate-binding protein